MSKTPDKTQEYIPAGEDERQATEARLRRLAWLLDNSIPIPGVGYRIGVDGFLGLIPGIGDTAGAALSTYILLQAAQLGVSRGTILRMAYNIAVDGLLGLVPILGDLFDFTWKANHRNVLLLERNIAEPDTAARADRWFVLSVVAAVLLFLGFLIWLGLSILGWLLGLILPA